MNKKILKTLGLILTILVLVGFGKTVAAEKKTGNDTALKETLVIAQKSDAKTLDPQKSIDTVSNKVMQMMFDTLTSMDENLNIEPGLAEKWERVDDYSMIFHLRKGVKFHNGDTMTSEDVKYSLDRAIASPQASYLFNPIKEVAIIDENTVKVTTKEPFGPLLKHLSTTNGSIINKRAAVEAGDDVFKNPVGTGQHKFKEWITGDRIVLESFPESWKGESKIKNVVFKNIPEVSNRMISLETGEIDVAFDIGIMDREAVMNHKKLELVEVEAPSSLYLAFDQTNPLFADIRVRQAIAYAVDNRVLAEAVFRGAAVPANSTLPTVVAGYNPDSNIYEVNIEKAKELLKEAGYPDGFNIKLWVNDESTRVDMCVIIQDQLKAVGINVEIEVFEWGTYLSKTLEQNKQLYLFSWNVSSGDADAALYPMFHSSQRNGSANRSNYVSKEADELLDKARNSVNEAERNLIYKEVQDILQRDLPHYTLVFPKLNLGMNKNVKGLVMKKTGYIDITNTYITKDNK